MKLRGRLQEARPTRVKTIQGHRTNTVSFRRPEMRPSPRPPETRPTSAVPSPNSDSNALLSCTTCGIGIMNSQPLGRHRLSGITGGPAHQFYLAIASHTFALKAMQWHLQKNLQWRRYRREVAGLIGTSPTRCSIQRNGASPIRNRHSSVSNDLLTQTRVLSKICLRAAALTVKSQTEWD